MPRAASHYQSHAVYKCVFRRETPVKWILHYMGPSKSTDNVKIYCHLCLKIGLYFLVASFFEREHKCLHWAKKTNQDWPASLRAKLGSIDPKPLSGLGTTHSVQFCSTHTQLSCKFTARPAEKIKVNPPDSPAVIALATVFPRCCRIPVRGTYPLDW